MIIQETKTLTQDGKEIEFKICRNTNETHKANGLTRALTLTLIAKAGYVSKQFRQYPELVKEKPCKK